MGDVFIKKAPLPAKIRGVTIVRDDDYIVIVNENLSPSARRNAIQHEIRHIKRGHFYSDDTVGYNEQDVGCC